jgi:hypothetical protein
MDETTNAIKQLEDAINKQHPRISNKPDTKNHAIHTILYAIIAVWLRFFEDVNNNNLFKYLPDKNKDEFAFVNKLLNQCTDLADLADLAKNASSKSAKSAKSDAADAFSDASAEYSADKQYAKFASVTDAANLAYCSSFSAAYFASIDTYTDVYTASAVYKFATKDFDTKVEYETEYAYSDVKSLPETVLFYLINAYIFLSLKT